MMDKITRGAHYKEDLKALVSYEFVKRSNEKVLRRKIQDMVDLARKTRKEELEEKRQRLRVLLTNQDQEYEQEFAKKIQAQAEQAFEAKKSRLKEIENQYQRENEDLIQLKKAQQHMNNCDTIHQKLRNDTLLDSKQCQLLQIEEKKQHVVQELEYNRIWDEMVRNRSLKQENIEECKELRKRQQMHNDSKILRQQMENKKLLLNELRREEREDLLKSQEELKTKLKLDIQKKTEEAAIKLQDARQLQRQLSEAIVLKKGRIDAQKSFDRMLHEAIDSQYQQEQREIEAKVNKLREATLTYLNYLRDLKIQKAQKERELELVTREFQLKADEEKERKIKKSKQMKALYAKQAYDELLEQMYANQMRSIKQKEREYLEAQEDKKTWEFETYQDTQKQRQRQEFALNYGKELQQQVVAIRAQQAEQNAVFEKDLVKAQEDDEFCKSLVSKFMSSNMNYLKAHPNWSLISCSCTKM